MVDCGCHDNDTSDALNMAFFVHSPSKPTTTQKDNGALKNLFPTLLHCLQESLLTDKNGQNWDIFRKHFPRVRDSGNNENKLRDSGIYEKLVRDSGSRPPIPDPD